MSDEHLDRGHLIHGLQQRSTSQSTSFSISLICLCCDVALCSVDAVVSDRLGTITFCYQGQTHCAAHTTNGSVLYNGQFFDSVSAWLAHGVGKR